VDLAGAVESTPADRRGMVADQNVAKMVEASFKEDFVVPDTADGWDPFASADEVAAVQEAEVPEVSVTAEVDDEEMPRFGQSEMNDMVTELTKRLEARQPWMKAAQVHVQTDFHLLQSEVEGWRHHDVKMEVGNGIAYVIMNRADQNNTMNETLSCASADAWMALQTRKDIRIVVLSGEGRMFCAGGDPKAWQAQAASARAGEHVTDGTVGVRIEMKPMTEEVYRAQMAIGQKAIHAGIENPDVGRLVGSRIMNALMRLPQFTICLANGSAMGGGVGWVCCCDYVIAVKKAYFVLSEVKIGVIPAVISPYVNAKLGPSNAKRFMCCAENLTAERAKKFGMVDEVVENMKEGHERVKDLVKKVNLCAPRAVDLSKQLIANYCNHKVDEALLFWLLGMTAEQAEEEEFKEGCENPEVNTKKSWQAQKIGFPDGKWPRCGVIDGGKAKKRIAAEEEQQDTAENS